MAKTLGRLETFILYAIVALGDGAYGAAIHREIQDRTGRSILIGAIYTVLDRLESQGLVTSAVGEPTAERGGRRRKFYTMLSAGAERLRAAHREYEAMTEGLGRRLERIR